MLEEFENTIQYPVRDFLNRVREFISIGAVEFEEYYTGKIQEVSKETLLVFNTLLVEIEHIFDKISLNNKQLVRLDFINVIELLEQVDNVLLNYKNIGKWLRSNRVGKTFTTNVDIIKHLKQEESIENVLSNIGVSSFYDKWKDIAVSNELEEESYDTSGGVKIKIPSSLVNFTYNLDSVVDTINDETILGKDIYKKITFENDDLKTTTALDTFTQGVEILSTTYLGDNPEFPNVGIDRKMIVGGNRNTLTLPIVLRQISQLFNSDDTIGGFEVMEVETKQDSISITMLVRSIRNDEVIVNI